MSGETRELNTVEEIDAEIDRLQKARDAQLHLINHPPERENRRIRREQLAGRWAVTLLLGEDHLQGIRNLAGTEDWLFEPSLLQSDGWERNNDGTWSSPRHSPSAGAGQQP